MTPGRREALVLTAAGLAAGVAGFFLGPALTGGRDPARDPRGSGALLEARLPDLAGKTRQLSEWRGRVLVCNFWATWCAPCREEIPLLMAARSKYASKGVEIVGIAVDNASKVGEFAALLRVSYPILLSESDGLELMRKLGNASGGLPYTIFLDRDGRVADRKLGALKEPELEGILTRLTQA